MGPLKVIFRIRLKTVFQIFEHLSGSSGAADEESVLFNGARSQKQILRRNAAQNDIF